MKNSISSAKQSAPRRFVHRFDFDFTRFQLNHELLENGTSVLRQRASFSVADMMLTQLNGDVLEPLELDLRDLAVALSLADRMAHRHPPGERDTGDRWWARHIQAQITVRDLERWNEIAVRRALTDYLFFTTGDYWEFEFVAPVPSLPMESAPIEDLGCGKWGSWHGRIGSLRNFRVVLWSGGVDSTGGLALEMEQYPDDHFLLVSVNTNPAMNARQDVLMKALPAEARERVTRLAIGVHFASSDLHCDDDEIRFVPHAGEKSVRTRSLLFLTAGTLAARRTGQSRFYVYENGIGAINLSFDRSQLRGQANRSVHPRTLALWSRFATALFRAPLVADNPFLFHTKAMMCHALDKPGWRPLIEATFTCGFPQRVKKRGVWHCGHCTSCLSRRQGFRAANMAREDKARYLFHPESQSNAAKLGRKNAQWLKVGSQMEKIRQAISGAAQHEYEAIWGRLCREFPELRDLALMGDVASGGRVLTPVQLRFHVVKLLRTYEDEGVGLTALPLQMLSSNTPHAPNEQDELATNETRRAA